MAIKGGPKGITEMSRGTEQGLLGREWSTAKRYENIGLFHLPAE
jgi:hypothetical protein